MLETDVPMMLHFPVSGGKLKLMKFSAPSLVCLSHRAGCRIWVITVKLGIYSESVALSTEFSNYNSLLRRLKSGNSLFATPATQQNAVLPGQLKRCPGDGILLAEKPDIFILMLGLP